MKLKNSSIILSGIIYMLINSCNMPECQNTNPIFRKFSPDKKAYKDELVKQVRNVGEVNLTYWHDKYLVRDGVEYIVADVQGPGLCAKVEIQVTDWRKMNGIRREVSGFRGARLEGLDFEIRQDSRETRFIFSDVDRVVD